MSHASANASRSLERRRRFAVDRGVSDGILKQLIVAVPTELGLHEVQHLLSKFWSVAIPSVEDLRFPAVIGLSCLIEFDNACINELAQLKETHRPSTTYKPGVLEKEVGWLVAGSSAPP